VANDEPSALREPGSLADLVGTVAKVLEPLPDKPEETAEATVRAPWHKAAGQAFSVQRASEEELPVLDPEQDNALRDLIDRRLTGTPLAYLTGRQQFMGLEFHVEPGALIPRKETELLAQTALELLGDARNEPGDGPGIIDLCTGSGNLADRKSVV
jgi:release factor glutamine methyltransferase